MNPFQLGCNTCLPFIFQPKELHLVSDRKQEVNKAMSVERF